MKTVTINYKELTDALAQLDIDYPSRIHGHIDLLRANIKYHLKDFLSGDLLTVELDDGKEWAYIGGSPISGDVYALYNTNEKEPATAEKMYEQILKAQKEAERLGIYDRVFGAVDSQPDDGHGVNEVVRAVCLQGFTYSKYQKAVVERYGQDMDDKIRRLFDELAWSRFWDSGKLKMTDTYTLALKYLGNEIGLDGETMEEIIHWQSANIERWQNSWGKRTGLIILVIASNASMREFCPNLLSKAEEVESLVHELIDHFCHFSYWEDVSLAIVNYAHSTKLSMRPTPFKDIDKHNCLYTTLMEGGQACISKGLEEALNLAHLNEKQSPNSKSYMVLISDGTDDNPTRTKAVLDIIKQKRNIEFYTYFVYSNESHKKLSTFGGPRRLYTLSSITSSYSPKKAQFDASIGGVSLENNFVSSLDWWIDRDIIPYPWYYQEGCYKECLNKDFNHE